MTNSRAAFCLVGAALFLSACGGSSNRTARATGEVIAFTSLEHGIHNLYVVRSDGSGFRELARNTYGDAAWSPDGSMIAFAKIRTPEERNCEYCSDLYVSAADGSGRRRLTDGADNTFPTWSPDRERIAFERCQPAQNPPCAIYAVRIDSGKLTRLTPDGIAGTPTWSPDGELIAFDKNAGVYVMARNGNNRRRLTLGRDTDPTWSPDGSKIAFSRGISLGARNPGWEIYVMRADGTALRHLAGGPRGKTSASEQAWSPDGKKIAFAEWGQVPSLDCAAVALYVIAPDGRGKRRLTPYRPNHNSPSWSPDGKQIAFLSERHCLGGNQQIYVMPAAGGEERLVSPEASGEDLGRPIWQPAIR